MSNSLDMIATAIGDLLGASTKVHVAFGEITVEVPSSEIKAACIKLRDEPQFAFEELMDLCGVDLLTYGQAEWDTSKATGSGFSRGVTRGDASDSEHDSNEKRFAVIYHLLSVKRNLRLRVKTLLAEDNLIVDSVVDVWSSANWYEREAFDLYGILFNGHPDLRRILTDYGFIGHPFRKDFPLMGNVEMRYDTEKRRVVYEPVSIEPRTLVPRVIREDRLEQTATDSEV